MKKDRKFLRVRAAKCERLRRVSDRSAVLLAMIDHGRGCKPGTRGLMANKNAGEARLAPNALVGGSGLCPVVVSGKESDER